MIVQHFLRQYINEDDVQHIIFHNGIIVIKETIKTIVFLGILYGIFALLNQYIHWPLLKWIFAGGGVILLLKYCFDFFNKYIDCLILSRDGVTVFSRDGFYKYKTEFFGREKIETVAHSQNTARDKILFKGNITLQLEHGIDIHFENVSQPKDHVKKMLALKDASEKEQEDPIEDEPIHHEHTGIDDNIAILTEALSEVVKEYLEKKKGT